MPAVAQHQAGSQAIVGTEGMDGDRAAHVKTLKDLEYQVLVEGIQRHLRGTATAIHTQKCTDAHDGI